MTYFEMLLVAVFFFYALLLAGAGIAFYFRKKKNAPPVAQPVFISVLVPARNESGQLADCLESLTRQEYDPAFFEVLVIDDHSTDDTIEEAEPVCRVNKNFRVLRNAPGAEGKKAAITTGVQAAAGTIIATTDADCVVGPGWLNEIAAAFQSPQAELACGLVVYKRRRGGFQRLLRAEQLVLQAVAAEAQFFCSGASLAYRKDFFTRIRGFENDAHISGDDMLLHREATSKHTRYFVSRDSLVYTEPAASFGEAIRQRGRWLSNSRAYGRPAAKGYAVVVLLANLLVALAGALVLAGKEEWYVFAAAFGGKTAVDLLLLSLAVPFFREPQLLLLVLPGELFYPVLALSASVKSLAGITSWKGRAWKK